MVVFILLSNDDGYFAQGLKTLATELAHIADITVVAPDRNRSGASNSLTLDRPLQPIVADNGFIYLSGTPTDCVHVALTGILSKQPDFVVSGINAGANLGDDVIYSGTVAAAMEGRFLGYPALAISLAGDQYIETAAIAARVLVENLQQQDCPSDTILNVNVPDIPWEQVKGFQTTRLGRRHRSQAAILSHNPRNEVIYWLGGVGEKEDAGEGTDFYALTQGYISVTPLHIDLTRYAVQKNVVCWLQKINDVAFATD